MNFIEDIDYLDQHFLIDKRVINLLIDECSFSIDDKVVEIGPGKCTLSEIIARKVSSLVLIEKDNRLEHYINILLDKYKNVSIIWNSVLNTFIPPCDKIVSTLPYSITEPFIEKLLLCDFKECILITGYSFANKVMNKELNKLSLLCNSFFDIEYIETISPDSFSPKPRVMSSLIRFKKKNRYDLLPDFKMFMFREMFYNRGRKLKNNLVESYIEYERCFGNKVTKKQSKSVIDGFNIDSSILDKYMESLSNEEFELLYNSMHL